STLVRQIRLAEKILVMKTTMVSKTGKKISRVLYGMLQTLILAALTMAMSKTCLMEQTHVIH
ncbi:MAG: hypothetical protein P8Q98_00775, partial [Candidatus Poseidoniaceae archaeon]|nr:hypothetical protein [Candidatus Poseidoniaceae archaeon]